MSKLVKICGVKTVETALAAARMGADMIGFVFYAKSPRYLAPEIAGDIALEVREVSYAEDFTPPRFVGLYVDAGEKLLAETAPFLSLFQFHGHEDAERIKSVQDEFGMDIIRAVGVADEADVERAAEFAEVADMLLFDAKPLKGSDRNGGNGLVFDWGALGNYRQATPFLLAGGLNSQNVREAIVTLAKMSSFIGVDVSSGIEIDPGVKHPAGIEAFIKSARNAYQEMGLK
ncbi:MAG: phosphoribosylanthranilate isomerase [Parvularculaceae bacterium]